MVLILPSPHIDHCHAVIARVVIASIGVAAIASAIVTKLLAFASTVLGSGTVVRIAAAFVARRNLGRIGYMSMDRLARSSDQVRALGRQNELRRS